MTNYRIRPHRRGWDRIGPYLNSELQKISTQTWERIWKRTAPGEPTTPVRVSTTCWSNELSGEYNNFPELIDKCRSLVDTQYKEADRALFGLGDLKLRPAYSASRQTLSRWQAISERQRRRVIADCFCLRLPNDTSTFTDGGLTVNYRSVADKKMNQRKRPCWTCAVMIIGLITVPRHPRHYVPSGFSMYIMTCSELNYMSFDSHVFCLSCKIHWHNEAFRK